MVMNVALVLESQTIGSDELLGVSSAIQKQVARDFAPFWNITATVDGFLKLEDVPTGFWPVIVVDEVATGELGVHGLRDKQPISLVKATPNWSLTASHEVLEMLADPFSSR